MSNKQLLIETHTVKISPSQLTENISKENGNLMVEGVLATAEVKNGNGRYYSKDLWNREMDKYKELIEQRRSMGELDHPESSVVNLKNVSHLVSDYWWDGDNILGKIEILPTPSGNILKELIKNGVTVGVSSRGMGSLQDMGGVMEVQDDFELLCWDFVSTPSTHGAFMKPAGIAIQELQEGIASSVSEYKYTNVNNIIRDIICDNTGMCEC